MSKKGVSDNMVECIKKMYDDTKGVVVMKWQILLNKEEV
jgi:hypothetical protein